MDDFSTNLEQMLREFLKSGPQLVEGQKSALSTAQQKHQQSIDELRGVYSDRSNFEQSPWGALGLGLMAPTKSGRFSEGMFNGLAAATAASNENRKQNLTRMEKLAKLTELEGTLSRQKAQDQGTLFNTQNGVITNSIAAQNTLSDLQLADQQLGSRPLQPGEAGPVAPDQSPEGRAELVYQDYMQNPQKYAGPQGQAMVKNAIDTLNNARTNNRMLTIANQRNQPKPRSFTTADKKIIDDAVTANSSLKVGLENMKRAAELGPKTWSGPFADTAARMASWWNGETGAANSTADETVEYQQIMMGEAIKQMSEQLKGATTDREMQRYIDMVADPTLPWNVKKTAVERVTKFIQSQIDVNNERIQGVRDGSYWTGVPADGSAPAPAAGGDKVVGTDKYGRDFTVDDITTTMEETGMTFEEVKQKLESGNY